MQFVLGTGTLGLLLFLAAVARLPGRLTLLTALAGGLGAAWIGPSVSEKTPSSRRAGWFSRAPLLLVLVPVFAVALPATLPPIAWFDALEYHLVLPSQNLVEGGLADRPDNFFSHLPHAGALVDGLVFAFDPSFRPGPFHWLLSLAAAILLARLVRRHLHPAAGPLAAAIFFASSEASMAIYVEGADLVFTGASILAIDLFLGSRRDHRLLPASFLVAGFVCSFKVQGIAVVAALAATVALIGRDRIRDGGGRRILLSGSLFAVPLVPWGIVNLVRHANPIYPYGAVLFGGPAGDRAWLDWITWYARVMAIDQGNPLRFPAAFLRQLFNPTVWNPLPLAAFLLPLAAGRRRARLEAAVVTAFLFLGWELIAAVSRYGFPACAMLSGLAAVAIAGLFARLPRFVIRPAALGALAAVLLLGGVSSVIGIFSSRDFVAYLIGVESETEYEGRTIPQSPRVLYRWANENLVQDVRILSLDEPRLYGLWRSCDGASMMDRRVLRRFLRGGTQDTPALVAGRIRAAGFTYLLANPAYADKWLVKIHSPFGYTLPERKLINDLLIEDARLVRKEGDASLWELRPPGLTDPGAGSISGDTDSVDRHAAPAPH